MDRIDDIVSRHAGREGPLLPILHDVQAAFGHVSEDAADGDVTQPGRLGLNLGKPGTGKVVPVDQQGIARFQTGCR